MFGFFKKKEDTKPAYSPVENNTEENNIKDFSEKTKETLENVGDKTQETFDNAKEEISDLKDNLLDSDKNNDDNVPSDYSEPEYEETNNVEHLEDLNDHNNDNETLHEEDSIVLNDGKDIEEPVQDLDTPVRTQDDLDEEQDNDLELLIGEEDVETADKETEDPDIETQDNLQVQETRNIELDPETDKDIEENTEDESLEKLTDFDSSRIFDENAEIVDDENELTDFDPESDLEDFFNENTEKETTGKEELPVVDEYVSEELEETYEYPNEDNEELNEDDHEGENEVIDESVEETDELENDSVEPIEEELNIVETEEKEDIIDNNEPLSLESNNVLVEDIEPNDTEVSTEESFPEIDEKVIEDDTSDKNIKFLHDEESLVDNENTPISYTINEEALNSEVNNNDKSTPIIVMNGTPDDIKNGISSYVEDYPVYLVDITENGSGYSYIPDNANKSYIEINEDDKYSPLDTFNVIKDKTNETGRSFIIFAGADRAADKLVEGFADSPVGLNVIAQQVNSLVEEAYKNNITIIITGETVNDNFSKLLNKIFYK